jgi:hypothetical protein
MVPIPDTARSTARDTNNKKGDAGDVMITMGDDTVRDKNRSSEKK